MKRYLYLILVIVLCLTLLSGCVAYNNAKSIKEKGNIDNSNQSKDIGDLQPTIYKDVNKLAGVTMNGKDGTISSSGITLVFKNDSDKQCTYGEFFILEEKINKSWYEVPVTINGNYGFNDIGYELFPGDNRELVVDWDWLYGNLDGGEYRIIKDILDFRGTGDFDKYYLTVEFTI